MTRTCSVARCSTPARTRGWCSKHYQRWWKYGDPTITQFDRAPNSAACTVDGCERPPWAKNLCDLHYQRQRRRGTTGLTRPPIDIRFASKVTDVSGCWEWQGELDSDGYGYFWADGRRWRAHRWSYARYVGPIPAGLEVDHTCGNRSCVRPEHLEPVTNAENTLRARQRAQARVTST